MRGRQVFATTHDFVDESDQVHYQKYASSSALVNVGNNQVVNSLKDIKLEINHYNIISFLCTQLMYVPNNKRPKETIVNYILDYFQFFNS